MKPPVPKGASSPKNPKSATVSVAEPILHYMRSTSLDNAAEKIGLSNERKTADGDDWTVHQGDARDTGIFLSKIAAKNGFEGEPFLTSTITSPPYANLVDYGPHEQIGFGQTYEKYLDECEAVFRDVFDWTLDHGSLWIVADSVMELKKGSTPSRLMPLPFDLSARASNAGWILRDVIIWKKDRTRPWAPRGKLRNGFEYVLFFVKDSSFKHHVERLRDIRGLKSWWVKYPERHNPWGMTPDNVWEIPIPVQGSWASTELRHACPFPPELVRRIVELSSDPGDVIFDPFSGSGMVATISEREGRRPLGTELSSDFCDAYREHVRPQYLKSEDPVLDVDGDNMTGTLLSLRVLKFPKELSKQMLRSGVSREHLLATIVTSDPITTAPRSTPFATVKCEIVVPDDLSDSKMEEIAEVAARVVSIAPLSKYGVQSSIRVVRVAAGGNDLSVTTESNFYLAGRTWKSSGRLVRSAIPEWLYALPAKGIPPVISPITVTVELED